MDTPAAKAILLLLVLALPSAAYSQNPYSDAAFRTFISVSTENTTVTARLTYLNLTYFSQVDEGAIADVYKKVETTKNVNDLYQQGSYSTDSFTAEIVPANNTALRFTFEGQAVLDASGTEKCNPVMTDENGMASCDIQYYRDSVTGAKKSLEEYKSCGYATINSDENGKLRLPSASQTAMVCPKDNKAISSFGTAIYTLISAPGALPFCFPAMLIAGLLVAAMYYSGRDPLSLFDITTPKLPKTQTFKVKMGQSPQMLRQVQRRYMMIKKQARRDSVREIVRLAKKAGLDSAGIAAAKGNMNSLYDLLESRMKNGKLADTDSLEFKSRLEKLMLENKPSSKKRYDRSLDITSGLLMAYLQSHQSMQAMAEARNKTSKGWWNRNVSQKVLNNLTDASVAFEGSKVGNVLGKIPFVRKVVSAPTKALDVSAQFRGSRNALKAVRAEMLGQVATMLGRTTVGKPVYNAFRRMHVNADGNATGFGKAYTFITGRNWKVFEDKHDLAKKRLVIYYGVIESIRQNAAIDPHNRMFDELASKLLDSIPIRASSMSELARRLKMSDNEIKNLTTANALDKIFEKLKKDLKGAKNGDKLVKELGALMATEAGKDFDKQKAKVEALIKTLKDGEKKDSVESFLRQLKQSAGLENVLSVEIKKLEDGKYTQTEFLEKLWWNATMHLYATTENRKEDLAHISQSIKEYKEAEKILRENALVYLKNGYYQVVEKKDLMEDLRAGLTTNELVKKYGKEVAALLDNPNQTYKALIDVRAASTGRGLREAIDKLLGMEGRLGLTAYEIQLMSQLSSQYEGKGKLSTNAVEKIKSQLDKINSLKEAEKRIFARFDAKETDMKNWVIADGHLELFRQYKKITDIFDKRLEGMAGANVQMIAREGMAFGRNPLELIIERATREAIIAKATANGVTDAAGLADKIVNFMKSTLDIDGKPVGRLKDIDSLEQFFKGKISGEAHTKEFANLLRALSNGKAPVSSEEIYKAAMISVNDFAREWSARNFAAGEILHGGGNASRYMISFENAAKNLLNSSKVRTNMAYLGGEKEFYRLELGMADYKTIGLESAVFTARGWEKLFGFVVSDKWVGTSRGEQVLHLSEAARKEYASAMERYKMLYKSLKDSESVFYDKTFADNNRGGWGVDAYDAIMKRGYTWQDKKNGLELLMSVDKKSTPMLEFEKKYMFWQKNKKEEDRDGIVRKTDIVDYAPLLARTMGSYYASREVGFVVLVKKDGKWVYGDPFLNKETQTALAEAEKKVTMRKDIMEKFLAMKDGAYNPENSSIRVISTKDFMTYAKDKNYSGKDKFFGEMNKADRMREGIRAALYKPGMLYGEFVYGAYSDRLDKMQAWYAAQYQLRQTLDILAHTMKDKQDLKNDDDGVTGGSKRFKYEEKAIDRIYDLAGAPKVHAGDDVRDALKVEMEKLSKGDGAFVDSAKAWWYNWRGRIASNIIGEIGSAESNYYNARLEMRALDKLYDKDRIGINDYSTLKKEMSARNDEIKSNYKKAKDEYGGLNRDIIGWVGSTHMFTYAPQRTIWNLGIVGKLLDSHHVQGTQDAFYQISESSVMRDPRVAIGASAPGWDHSYYVGYHTGQNVYERTRFWATNSMWEKQMQFHTDLVYTVHKWWNDRMSFFARYTSGYPAPVKSDMMSAPTYEPRKTSDYFKALFVIMPFQPRTYSDYHRARLQDAISFSGAGAMLAAYQSLGNVSRYDTPGEGQETRSWLRRQIDKFGAESDHYYETPYRITSQQRYIDQIMNFESYVDKNGSRVEVEVNGIKMSLNDARDGLKHAIATMDTDTQEKYKHGISDAIGEVANLNDRRGAYVRQVFSGSDIQEDGSRNRFLDLYSTFHSNAFMPTIPGMLQSSPIGKGEWHTFPQVARMVDEADEKTRLGAMKNYWRAGYEVGQNGTERIRFSDQFSTKQDAVAEAYRNDVPVLMHLMKMQNKEIGYSIINSPSLAYVNPIWFGLGRMAYKTILAKTPGMESFSSTFHQPDWTHFALGAVPFGNAAHDYIRRRRGELPPRETLDGDYRHQIYGLKTHAIVDDAEKTNSFFRWWRDGVYGFKFKAAPGWRPVSKETKEEYVGAMFGRK